MKTQLSFFIVVLFFVSVYGQPEDTPQIYCGRRLAQVMAVMCYQKYNKRSDYAPMRLGFEQEFGWPWTSTRMSDRPHLQDMKDLQDMGARGKRGIIEECCDKSCAVETLMSYC